MDVEEGLKCEVRTMVIQRARRDDAKRKRK